MAEGDYIMIAVISLQNRLKARTQVGPFEVVLVADAYTAYQCDRNDAVQSVVFVLQYYMSVHQILTVYTAR